MASGKYKYELINNGNDTVTIRRAVIGSKTKQKNSQQRFRDVIIQCFDESDFHELKELEVSLRNAPSIGVTKETLSIGRIVRILKPGKRTRSQSRSAE